MRGWSCCSDFEQIVTPPHWYRENSPPKGTGTVLNDHNYPIMIRFLLIPTFKINTKFLFDLFPPFLRPIMSILTILRTSGTRFVTIENTFHVTTFSG
jgi:hypothetical protein